MPNLAAPIPMAVTATLFFRNSRLDFFITCLLDFSIDNLDQGCGFKACRIALIRELLWGFGATYW
jgi:hypothetical protein